MSECMICKSPISPEHIICKECAEKIIKHEERYYILPARQNGKNFLTLKIYEDLKFYVEEMKGENDG